MVWCVLSANRADVKTCIILYLRLNPKSRAFERVSALGMAFKQQPFILSSALVLEVRRHLGLGLLSGIISIRTFVLIWLE